MQNAGVRLLTEDLNDLPSLKPTATHPAVDADRSEVVTPVQHRGLRPQITRPMLIKVKKSLTQENRQLCRLRPSRQGQFTSAPDAAAAQARTLLTVETAASICNLDNRTARQPHHRHGQIPIHLHNGHHHRRGRVFRINPMSLALLIFGGSDH